MSPTPRQIGMALKRVRESKDISQYALAEAAGLSREYIRKLEAGESDATLGTLQRLANALNVSVMVLIASRERLEELARTAVAGAEGDLPAAMSFVATEIKREPHLITCLWKELRESGKEERRRKAEAVEIAKRAISQIPPLSNPRLGDSGRQTVTYLAQGLTDLVERANKKQSK
jgi:transcriptional regulator with XRE-family HTH domain